MPSDHQAHAPERTPAGDPWAALEVALAALVGATLDPAQQHELLGEFMAMGQSHDAERQQLVWGYKHVDTRLYLFLDAAGRAYHYDVTSGRYVARPVRDALARARAAA